MTSRWIARLLCGLLAYAAPAVADETVSNPTVATVNGAVIDADDVRWEMVRRGADFLPRFSKIEEKEAVVDELVRIEVLAQKARQEGYADDPEIRRSVNRLLAEKYWRDQVAKAQVPAVAPADVRAYYDAHPAEFTQPKKVRGNVIVLRWKSTATHAERVELRTKAERLAAEAKGMTPSAFSTLVAEHTTDPRGKQVAGDTGFIVEGTTVFQFEPLATDALFALGEVGGVTAVSGERGAYVVRLSAREGGTLTPFEAVESRIRERLTIERKEQFEEGRYTELRKQCAVTVDSKVLRTVGPQDLTAHARPPMFPVGEKVR